jgi:hypothetical protein
MTPATPMITTTIITIIMGLGSRVPPAGTIIPIPK